MLEDPKEAIRKGFDEAEKTFLSSAMVNSSYSAELIETSGTCALILIIIENICYVANLGDSRALLSEDSGDKIYQLTVDHKPEDPSEKKRIETYVK